MALANYTMKPRVGCKAGAGFYFKGVGAFRLSIPIFTGERPLGVFTAGCAVRLEREHLLPLGIGEAQAGGIGAGRGYGRW
ncbi:hypothetical protein GCM10011378_30310 [Hymenobacter glacieicola]|uniref:GAF domain-containing protein n=1 Tax=Hymenobacter glacieicola TaxID=1562124 RepID=A0ABQ1WZ36_9BACT|nr:hypothetical protein GCM10011378_30310 [Hymenobacter glacieicola]